MAVKKAAAATATKRAPAKKTSKGDGYECEVCGLAVTVDTDCGCVEACDIICCGESMKPTAKKAKATAKK